jgi:hypothetical protein
MTFTVDFRTGRLGAWAGEKGKVASRLLRRKERVAARWLPRVLRRAKSARLRMTKLERMTNREGWKRGEYEGEDGDGAGWVD